LSKGKEPRGKVKILKLFAKWKRRNKFILFTRRWAWKQPSFKESVKAHWFKYFFPKMKRGLVNISKLCISKKILLMVTEFSVNWIKLKNLFWKYSELRILTLVAIYNVVKNHYRCKFEVFIVKKYFQELGGL